MDMKVYGNYCGPGWSGGKYVALGEVPDFDVPKYDDLDGICRIHDKEYYEAEKKLLNGDNSGYRESILSADRNLLERVSGLIRDIIEGKAAPSPSSQELIYAQSVYLAFVVKVKYWDIPKSIEAGPSAETNRAIDQSLWQLLPISMAANEANLQPYDAQSITLPPGSDLSDGGEKYTVKWNDDGSSIHTEYDRAGNVTKQYLPALPARESSPSDMGNGDGDWGGQGSALAPGDEGGGSDDGSGGSGSAGEGGDGGYGGGGEGGGGGGGIQELESVGLHHTNSKNSASHLNNINTARQHAAATSLIHAMAEFAPSMGVSIADSNVDRVDKAMILTVSH